MQHHVLLGDRDPRLFDALVRELRLRLYEGRPEERAGLRLASLRQGPSPRFAAGLFGLGLAGLLASGLAVSELGRSSRQLAWDGGAAHAAVPADRSAAAPSRLPLVAGALVVMAAGIVLAAQERKQMWLVARPGGRQGRTDLWVAGAVRGEPERFAREFEAFVERAGALDEALQCPPAAAPATPPAESGDTGERTSCRGTGPAARPWAGSGNPCPEQDDTTRNG